MNPTLSRLTQDDQGTFGILRLPDGRRWYTGELPWRNNMRKISCIPAGTYDCRWHKSPKFGLVYRVNGVHNRSEILFHAGNFVGDERLYQTNVQGCILLGKKIVAMKNKDGKWQRALGLSKIALREFHKAMGGKSFTLKIEDVDYV